MFVILHRSRRHRCYWRHLSDYFRSTGNLYTLSSSKHCSVRVQSVAFYYLTNVTNGKIIPVAKGRQRARGDANRVQKGVFHDYLPLFPSLTAMLCMILCKVSSFVSRSHSTCTIIMMLISLSNNCFSHECIFWCLFCLGCPGLLVRK